MSYCRAREDFREFLKTIDLDKYRMLLKDKKYVEQDLPEGVVKEMLKSLYEYYWVNKQFLSFDDWFNAIWSRVTKLKEFKDFIWYYWHMTLGKDKDWDEWFKVGFKARLYRTWTAVLTQFDFMYTFACVLEEKGMKMPILASPELNAKGIDLRLRVEDNLIDIQVSKVSQRKDVRGKTGKGVIVIPYPVVSRRDLVGRPNILNIFDKYYEELENGFIVFKKKLAEEVLNRMLRGEDVSRFTEKLAECFVGKKCELTSQ
jgi:hypothetical protein